MPRFSRFKKTKSYKRVDWNSAPDIKKRVDKLVKTLSLHWIKPSRIYCYRSNNSKARAYARIWGMSKIWQLALEEEPAYVIEVLSEKFDGLSNGQKENILLHEIAHIPKNFSGSLLPHVKKRGKRNFDDRVRQLVRQNNKRK